MIFAANWKMFFSTKKAIHFYNQYKNELAQLGSHPDATIILCPPVTALSSIQELGLQKNLSLGAQDCFYESSGAYTGFISAQDLSELGCTYVLVGHSEQRLYGHNTNKIVALKALSVMQSKMKPIFCIGECYADRLNETMFNFLSEQLYDLIEFLKDYEGTFIIAYEPVWAIGTGIIPSPEQIEEVFVWLQNFLHKQLPLLQPIFLYGGSVSSKSMDTLQQISLLQGFLIGKASLDFQEFKKIVDCSLRQS